ncbi:hypothetical protein [Schaalia sp. lx-100]|nr:hypothetical protein [Schaalia sp. lx-100]
MVIGAANEDIPLWHIPAGGLIAGANLLALYQLGKREVSDEKADE